jgi:hypothetical protein
MKSTLAVGGGGEGAIAENWLCQIKAFINQPSSKNPTSPHAIHERDVAENLQANPIPPVRGIKAGAAARGRGRLWCGCGSGAGRSSRRGGGSGLS